MAYHDYFSALAKQYATHRPTYPKLLFDYLASLAPGRELAWDCGTGNGQAALQLAQYFERVIATDASQEQLENAVPHDRVEYRVEQAEAPSIDSNTVDVITVGVAVHWFDLDVFYDQVRRVGTPGAVIAVWTYHLPSIAPAVDRVLKKFYYDIVDGYWPDRFHYVAERYRTLPFPFEDVQPPEFAMETEWDLDNVVGFLASWSATRRYLDEKGSHPVNEILSDLQTAWGDENQKRVLRWPLYVRIGRLPR